jgi:hypothetical protein
MTFRFRTIDDVPATGAERARQTASGRRRGTQKQHEWPSAADDKLRPELELRADSEGHFNMLVELADVSGLEASAIKDDLVFAKDFKDSIDRLAIVTQDDVFSTVAEFVGSPLGEVLGVEVKRFDEPDVAWTWIRGSGSN